ncbi:peptidoglycan-binding protein [Labrenzia sp. R4_2]|uniref:peptidoglycan-binding domain-containing protein n=1 Tax=Labrenzia sp. R4_2 TaxID=2821107 RepID=UPI001ADA1234|nr:peptidoglycan-binding domain-containing protein [Labrenzia sp. R4_2]MBO9422378.1 peptidoglycan-binding protein [Labrenzia sp. R4_2]
MKKYLPVVISLTFIPSPVFSDVWTFETPSENVQCVVGQEIGVLSDISCTIIEKSGPPAKPRPNSCQEGWGHTFSMREKGPVEMICQDPSQDKSGFNRADYGVTGNFGGFTCHSSTKGLKCTNRDGNGFFLSRRHQYVIGTYRDSQGSTKAAVSEDQKSANIGNYPVWGAEFGQGIVEASVGDGNGSELRLVCNISGLDTIASKLSFGPQSGVPSFASAGSTVEFLFDGLHSAPILLNADDSFVVKKDAVSIGTFNFLIGRLKKHSFVVVKLPDGQQLKFSLRGSSKAIGLCPPTPSTNPIQSANTTTDQSSSLPNQPVAHSRTQFSDYPAVADLRSNAKYPDFGGRDRNFKTYRTRIRNGIDQGVNFAGHYSFIVIGCGTECKFGFVVDLRTGEVFDFPYGGEEQYQMDLQFTKNSRLVKVRWKGDWQSTSCTEKDLVVDGISWQILAERTVPTDDGLCFFPAVNTTALEVQKETRTSVDGQGINSIAVGTSKPVEVHGNSTSPNADSVAISSAENTDSQEQNWETSERYLKTLGNDPGIVDGIVDAKTIEAVTTFQKTYGLKVLGYLPPEHFLILRALAETQTGPRSETKDSVDGPDNSKFAADAYSVRQRIVEDKNLFLDKLQKTVSASSLQVLRNVGVFDQLIVGSVPFVGCIGETNRVYGFYSPTKNFWTFAEVSSTSGRLVDARISSGLVPLAGPEDVAWFNFMDESKNIPEALQHAALIQLNLFSDYFPDKDCQPISAMDHVFDQASGLEQIAISEDEKPQQAGRLSQKLAKTVSTTYELPNETVLVNTLLLENVAGFRYLSAFTSEKNANLFLLQGWRNNDDELQLAEFSHSVIFEIDQP